MPEPFIDKIPFFIAEISCNHAGSIERAKKLIRSAKEAGASAVKVQCYTPDEMIAPNCDLVVPSGKWAGKKLRDLYVQGQTPREWIPELLAEGKEVGIPVFSTVYTPAMVEWLEKNCDLPAYKIASFEMCYRDLLSAVAETGRPVVISMGCSNSDERRRAISFLAEKAKEVVALFCVSKYPTPPEDFDFIRWGSEAQDMRNYRDNIMFGLSDHSMGSAWVIPVLAMGWGMSVIEKHVTLLEEETLDEDFSATPREFAAMVDYCTSAYRICAWKKKRAEEETYFRRTFYVNRDVKKQESVKEADLAAFRPWALGAVSPDAVLTQRKYKRDLPAWTMLTWDLLT